MKRTRLLLALVFCVLAISCSKGREYPEFGSAPVDTLHEHEAKEETLLAWSRAGLRKATLVSVNAVLGLGPVDAGALKDIKKLSAGREWDEFGRLLGPDGPVNADNYMTAAMTLGLIKKIYWVMPYRLFHNIAYAEREIKDFLKRSKAGLSDAEIDGMKMDAGCLTGQVRGGQLYACGFSTLHRIPGPVALDIGVDFFAAMAREYGVNKLGAIKTLFDALSLRELRVMRADVTYGIREGRTRPIHRFLGEETVELLKNPKTLKTNQPPELWAARDMAENMFSGGEGSLVLKYLEDPLKKFPQDPALIMLQAAALVRAGKGMAALDRSVKLCTARKDYCEGLAYLAYLADIKGDQRVKSLFRSKAQEIIPEGRQAQNSLRYAASVISHSAAGSDPRERY